MNTLKLSSVAKQRLPIIAILLFSVFVNLYRLDRVGTNGAGIIYYYAAAVKSMLASWKNFFYLSVDPAGFVSLDKAPLAFWIQALLAKTFGFSGLALLLPQALAGIATVYVLYCLVRRAYGENAALWAALGLAIMPASVLTQRNNSPDALMTFVLVLAAWALTRALGDHSPHWLFATGALVGIAFNIKMLQILLVVPAYVALYLWAAPWSWRKRLLYGLEAFGIAVLVSAPWVLVVEFTPPGQRPYVGGSANNTVFDLIFNYNGLARLWGKNLNSYIGSPGILRIFNEYLGGQLSWFLPLALFGAGVAIWQLRRTASQEKAARRNGLILYLVWLIPPVIYFSISTFFHSYYLATIAPALAALFGIGVQAFWDLWRSADRRQRILVLGALLVCVGVQIALVLPFPAWSKWLIPLMAITSFVGWTGLWFARRFGVKFQAAAYAFSLFSLLISPLVWTLSPVFTCTSETMPYAGPPILSPGTVCKSVDHAEFMNHEWLAALEQGRGGARFMAATHDMGLAVMGILETNQPFMALGGYSGRDPILTVDQFAGYVARGEVRYYIALGNIRYYTALGTGTEFPVQKEIRQWVQAHCPPVLSADPVILIWGPCEAGEQ